MGYIGCNSEDGTDMYSSGNYYVTVDVTIKGRITIQTSDPSDCTDEIYDNLDELIFNGDVEYDIIDIEEDDEH